MQRSDGRCLWLPEIWSPVAMARRGGPGFVPVSHGYCPYLSRCCARAKLVRLATTCPVHPQKSNLARRSEPPGA